MGKYGRKQLNYFCFKINFPREVSTRIDYTQGSTTAAANVERLFLSLACLYHAIMFINDVIVINDSSLVFYSYFLFCSVPAFAHLSSDMLSKIADALEEVSEYSYSMPT